MQFRTLVSLMIFSLALAHPQLDGEKELVNLKSKHVNEEAVRNFGYMSSCATNSYSTRYNGYGCFCGIGGSGTAVDDLDSCCEAHDNCYGDLLADGGPCSSDTNLYTLDYDYSCTAPWSWFYPSDTVIITCDSGANNECEQALCDCDKVGSLCFAANEYNDAYASYDKDNLC